MAWFSPYKALYLHIPFCARRCAYCDFTTEAVNPDDPRIDVYTDDLTLAIRRAMREGLLAEIETVYIGGGTPSFLGHRRFVDLVYTLAVSLNLKPDTEFTVEANPESFTKALARDLVSLGVNRLSLGVQTFVDSELAALGRIHEARSAQQAIMAAQERFSSVSIDLMCGIPRQSLASWQQTLARAIESGVNHLSIYPLTIEPDTPLAKAIAVGQQAPPDEDLQAQMMEDAAGVLTAAGFSRYEVASYAQPGHECCHNIAYWTGLPYLGLGHGAAGMRENAAGRQRLLDGVVIEELDRSQALLEDLMLGMRLSRGVAFDLVRQAAESLPEIVDTFENLIALGLVNYRDGRYQPTEKGWLCGNEIYGRILATGAS